MAAAVRILSGREHSRAELRRKLLQRGYDRETVEQTLTKLRDLAYLDDRRFAEALIRQRVQIKLRGLEDVRQRLMIAGVSREIIDNALEDARDDLDLRSVCREAGKKRLATLNEPDAKKKKAKLIRHLIGRGFEPDTVFGVAAQLLDTEYEEYT